MRYDREAVVSFIEFIFNPGLWGNKIINLRNVACHVTHVYYRSAPTGAMGAGIINMRKSTRNVDFHMLIMNRPQIDVWTNFSICSSIYF